MKRLTLTLGLLALAAVLAACSGASAQRRAAQLPGRQPRAATVAVVAKDLKFVAPAVAVKAGTAFAIDFDNQDGAPHNIAISDAGGAKVFKGDIVSSTKVSYHGPGARRRHVHLHLRGPSRHEGHDHRPVIGPSSAAIEASGLAGGFGTFHRDHARLDKIRQVNRSARSGPARSSIDRRPRRSPRSLRMLEILDLTKRYGPVVALDGASFTARPGRIVGFLGPNGAGKTTTMRCVFGLAVPDRGEVRWKGRPVDRDMRLRFGYMPEQRGLYPRMRVAEQLSYFGQQHGMSGKAANAAAGPVARADGPRRPRQVQARGAVARQPATRPAGDGARPRPRAARPRRAVLRARPDRHRDHDRRRPRAGGGRCRRRLQQPPARSRRGRVRGRRHHRSRADRRFGRHRRAQGRLGPPAPRDRGRGSNGDWLDGHDNAAGARADRRQGQAAGRPRRRPRWPARPGAR